jgi:hypothetical protein
MLEALLTFQVREPVAEEYQVPAVDVLNDDSGGVLVVPPPAPVIVSVTGAGVLWETLDTATGYYVEQLVSGTVWQRIGTVNQAPSVQLFWNVTEWDLNVLDAGVWKNLYRSIDDVATPDLVTTWLANEGDTPLPTVTINGPVEAGDMTVSEAGDERVNGVYGFAGNANGRDSYNGMLLASLAFTPASVVRYRVRAFNTAGSGAPSNAMTLEE